MLFNRLNQRRAVWRGLALLLVMLGLTAGVLGACSAAGEPGLAVYLRTHSGDLDKPSGTASGPQRFVVEPGMSARIIAESMTPPTAAVQAGPEPETAVTASI